MDIKFNNSKPNTIGLELEIRLLDPISYGVKNCSDVVFENIDDELKPHIHKELLKSMFEVVTPVCGSAFEAVDFIDNSLQKIKKIGEQNDFLIAALATHPFEEQKDNKIIPDPRYLEFEEEFQIIIRNFLISGLHIHVGIEDHEKAIKVYNSMINYIPLFLALSANSPFLHSIDSGLSSYRTKIFDKLPRAGVPEYFESFEEYKNLYKSLYKSGTIKKIKDVWWDIRLSPNFGTIELRVCDAFYDKDRLSFITMFFQALVEYSKNNPSKKEFHQINLQNKWSATRYGMDGNFIEDGLSVEIRDKINALIFDMDKKGIFDKLGVKEQIQSLKYIIKEPSLSNILRAKYNEAKDFKEVIKLGVL
jgi:carboxylate-amine ligase